MKSTVKRQGGAGKNIDSKLQMIKLLKPHREAIEEKTEKSSAAIEEKLEKSVADLNAKIKE